MKPTRQVAEWASALDYDQLPDSVIDKTRLQIMSVLGATAEGASSSKIAKYRRAVDRARGAAGGSHGPCRFFPDGERGALGDTLLVNAAASVVHDFDDYLFAGHTGHSAVLASLALAELLSSEGTPATGERLVTAAVAANEAAGRLGMSMLFGPHNGQMWSYIHLIGGAVAGAVLLGLDARQTESAIGMAFSQPNFPLVASFMGSDAKALIAAQPAVDGARGALFAAEGLNGASGILEDKGGFWAKFQKDALAKVFSGFGNAWLTESLCYKIYPGCAYIDTAMDALFQIMSEHEAATGSPLTAEDVDEVDVEAQFLTTGMETMSGWYRGEHISPMNVNFSVALSGSVAILAGRLTASEFEPDFYLTRENEILDLAKRWKITNSAELNAGISPKGADFDLREVLRRDRDALDGIDMSKYESRFPAVVRLRTIAGDEYEVRRDIPLGGAGRPAEETRRLVEEKLLNGVGRAVGRPRAVDLLSRVRDIDRSPDAAVALSAS